MKKIFGTAVVTMMAVAVFITTKSVDQTGNTQLADLATLNTANAECYSGPVMQGLCSPLSNLCFYDWFSNDCDPGWGY